MDSGGAERDRGRGGGGWREARGGTGRKGEGQGEEKGQGEGEEERGTPTGERRVGGGEGGGRSHRAEASCEASATRGYVVRSFSRSGGSFSRSGRSVGRRVGQWVGGESPTGPDPG